MSKTKVKIKSMEKLRKLAHEGKIRFGIPGLNQGDFDEATYITIPMEPGNFDGSFSVFRHDSYTGEYLIVDYPNVIHPNTYNACKILFEDSDEQE